MKDEDKEKDILLGELRGVRSLLEISESRRSKAETAVNRLTRSIERCKRQLEKAHEEAHHRGQDPHLHAPEARGKRNLGVAPPELLDDRCARTTPR